MTPLSRPSLNRFFEEFHCRECGFPSAYRSRPRTFFERYMLPFLLLQPVRCDRCYHRSYALRTIPMLERAQPERKPAQSESAESTSSQSHIA